MMQVKQPSWLPEKLRHLGQTGKLDLSGESFEDLSFVGSRPSMKQLDISFSPIQTIEGLQFQPKLDTLIADSSELSNFKNFRAVQKVSSVSIKNTPVSHFPTFKLSLLIVIGPTLRVINGQYISQKLRDKAKQYPPIAADLVNCGWIAEYPCPDEDELETIKKSFGLAEIEETESQESSDDESKGIDFNKTVEYYTSMHKRMIQQAQQQIVESSFDSSRLSEKERPKTDSNSILQEIQKDSSHLSLCDKVQLLLHHYGYTIENENRTTTMLHIISHLLSQLETNETEEETNDEQQSNDRIEHSVNTAQTNELNAFSDNDASDEDIYDENEQEQENELNANQMNKDYDSSDEDFDEQVGVKNDSDLRWEEFIAQIQNE